MQWPQWDQAVGWWSLVKTITFCDVNDKDHCVYDLCASNDGADEGRVARAVNQGELQGLMPQLLQLCRCWHLHRGHSSSKKSRRRKGCHDAGFARFLMCCPGRRRGLCVANTVSLLTVKAEKPRSSVMPRSLL